MTTDVDVLLNNAGISEGGAVVDLPAEVLRRQFEVNVFGPVLLTQGIAKQMAGAAAVASCSCHRSPG